MKPPREGAPVDWLYARPGCESCAKARAELGRRKSEVRAERSTRQPLDDAEAKNLLASVDEVWIARAGRVERHDAGAVGVADLKGPTGGVRAPLLRRGRSLFVGFGAATLREWLDTTEPRRKGARP